MDVTGKVVTAVDQAISLAKPGEVNYPETPKRIRKNAKKRRMGRKIRGPTRTCFEYNYNLK